MINMPFREFVQIATRAIRYDGTNGDEIRAEFAPGSVTETSEVGGVWELEHVMYGPIVVTAGDWYRKGEWFFPDSDAKLHYREISLGVPE